jgi:hypothetical protein
MRFDLTKPCDNCPFLKEGGIRVHPERAREIAESQINGEGGGASFACHKTTIGDGNGDLVQGPRSQYCAGALAFAIKVESFNQLLQIASRLGWWDPSAIQPQAIETVFGSVLEMVAGQIERPVPKGRSTNLTRAGKIRKRRTF